MAREVEQLGFAAVRAEKTKDTAIIRELAVAKQHEVLAGHFSRDQSPSWYVV